MPDLHFFDGLDENGGQDNIVMTSFPRSGNSMLRATLERVMGIVTGSDANIELKLCGALMDMGLQGEGLFDKRVWVVKTHYPERVGKSKFPSQRALLLVRSPLDCITSLFHMTATGSHDLSISDEDFVKHSKLWEDWVA